MRPQHGLRGTLRRDDERRGGAEVEEHEAVAAVLGGDVAKGDMRVGADEEVQLADDGEPAAGRRQLAQQLFSGSGSRGGRRWSPEAAHD